MKLARILVPLVILIGFISASFSIAATNGGIGSYPLAIYAAFSIFGIAEEPSIAFGWIMWASQTLLIILFGGLSLIYLPIFNRRKTLKEDWLLQKNANSIFLIKVSKTAFLNFHLISYLAVINLKSFLKWRNQSFFY